MYSKLSEWLDLLINLLSFHSTSIYLKWTGGQWLFPVSNGRTCTSNVHMDLKGKSKGRAGIKEWHRRDNQLQGGEIRLQKAQGVFSLLFRWLGWRILALAPFHYITNAHIKPLQHLAGIAKKMNYHFTAWDGRRVLALAHYLCLQRQLA